jgi:dephospho-CoA kinase
MKVGVTGIFASGKGTVCEMFEELGAIVIDTDILARDVVAPGTEGLQKLIEVFGDSIVDNGRLDRRYLANVVFKDDEKVRQLNSITHPLILQKAMDIVSRNTGRIFMINTPLLFESGFNRYMDTNIVVLAKTNQVLERGVERDGISREEIQERLKYQISLNEKKKMADYVIDNSGTRENTRKQVEEIWNILNMNSKNR